MRRRTVLAAAVLGAPGLLGGMSACSATGPSGATPAPSPATPPGPDAVPSALGAESLWPGEFYVVSTITALREHYLVGSVQASEAGSYVQGMCPAVVDLDGPSTWGVLLGDDGQWATRPVQPDHQAGPGDDPDDDEPTTMLVPGPSVIDDTYAYLVVAALAGVPHNQEHYSPPGDACAVSLVKVSLKGSLEAVATVSQDLPASAVKGLCLSFTQDRAGLLLTGGPDTEDSSSDLTPDNHIGLRLSAQDLSVEADSRDILRGRGYGTVSPCGQAVAARSRPGLGGALVNLEEGVLLELPEGAFPQMVREGWLYYRQENGDRAQRLGSQEVVALEGMDGIQSTQGSWPEIYSDQPETVLIGRTEAGRALRVLRPGQTAPLLAWDGEAQVPQGACVLGDVLYAWYEDEAGEGARVEMVSLGDGQAGDTLGACETGEMAVGTLSGPPVLTPWGAAVNGRFYPATRWLDAAAGTGAGSPSPQASSSTTG